MRGNRHSKKETVGAVNTRGSTIAAIVLAVVVATGVTSCTVPPPSTHGPTSSASLAPSEEPAPQETADSIEAIIVVASVDTDGANVSASGYVSGTLEEGRTCTFRFSQAGTDFDHTSESVADRLTTSCGLVQAPIGQFVRGPANVTLKFDGVDGVVESAPVEFEVP